MQYARWTARSTVMLLLLASVSVQPIGAQEQGDSTRAGERPLLPRDREVALARSAAAPGFSDSASVFVLTASGYVLAEQGSNGIACYVSRSWPRSIEPHCFDSEGAASIMPMHMHEVELLHRGHTLEAARREVALLLLAGKFRLPRRPAMSWMLSAEQQLISDTGQPVGRWRPHIMIYYPFLENLPFTSSQSGIDGGTVSEPGSAWSSIVIPVVDFVPVRPGTTRPT